jgi:hypothetical protein
MTTVKSAPPAHPLATSFNLKIKYRSAVAFEYYCYRGLDYASEDPDPRYCPPFIDVRRRRRGGTQYYLASLLRISSVNLTLKFFNCKTFRLYAYPELR